MSINNVILSSKFYDKRYDFNFEIVNFLFLDEGVPRARLLMVYIVRSLFLLQEYVQTSTMETNFDC